MKRCPQCHQTYTDETLKFCRDDGALLQVNGSSSAESSDTLILSSVRSSDALPTQLLESEAAQAKKTTSSIEVSSSPQTGKIKGSHANKRHKRGIAIALSVLILAVLGFGFWLLKNRSSSDSASPAPIESIAVLPFVNESGNADNEYLSDGLTESLIGSLSQIPKLKVKARSSVFRYKGKETDAKKIGQELSVQAVLTGRVIQRGEQLILNLELVDAQTENVIWSEQYNRKQTDLISLQTEIAHDVSQKLKTKLSGADEQRVAKNYTENVEAYQLYVQGRFYWNRRTVPDLQKSIEYFNQAIAIDPNYALAYTGLSNAYSNLAENAKTPPEILAKARDAALKAISLDDNLAEAHAALAHEITKSDYNFVGAEREFKRAIELNPNYSTAHQWYGNLLSFIARHDESLAELRRALDLDPFSIIINNNYGIALYNARRYDESIEQFKKTIELNPNFSPTARNLSWVYLKTGKYTESVEEFARYQELLGEPKAAALVRESYARNGWQGFLRLMTDEGQPIKVLPFDLAIYYAALGDKEKAFSQLERSYDGGQLLWLKVEPLLDPLRDDPRFQELLKKVGFPP